MPEPVPTPTAIDIVSVSEIALIPVGDVLSAVSADDDQDISNEKWLRTLDDLEIWSGGIGTGQSKLKRLGTMEFFEGKGEDARLDLRNKIRTRYGYPALTSEAEATAVLTEIASLPWF